VRTIALAGLVLAFGVSATAAPRVSHAPAADCTKTSVGLTPLTDLKGKYKGFRGGLYPGERNAPPARYRGQGLVQAKLVKPRDAAGRRDPAGKVVLLSIGMSNTTQEFSVFKRIADADPRRQAAVVVVDGAQGGQDAEQIRDGGARFWQVVDSRLQREGVTAAQVQVAWLKQAIARPTEPFPDDARRLQADLRLIVAVMRRRYPNLRLVYLSSRTYAGYATTSLNPEPYAYQSGFAVRWLVQERIAGKLPRRPWLGWGPYLWTDGTRGRRDGLVWTCDDVRRDGTHPSPSGAQKVASLLLRFLTTNATARPWFAAD
jgi:hypothetical protein